MEDKKKIKEFEFVGGSLYFPKKKILVFADLHIGYEEYLNEGGIFIPRTQFKEIMRDLKKIFWELQENKKEIKEIIILGDLKHGFGKISGQEWKDVRGVLDFFKTKSKKIILVKGNHDITLEPIAKREELEIKDHYVKDEICFLHGHKFFTECLDKNIKLMVMGHRHPAVVLSDKYKREKYKCFLVGKWKGKKVIILPSFFPFVEGGDIINYGENKLFIPMKKLKSFGVFVVGDKTYKFGKLKGVV